MEETLQCVSARGANDLACRLKIGGVGKGNGTFRFCLFSGFFFFLFLKEYFTDGTPVSPSLYSVRFHQHPAMDSANDCVSMWYMQ